MSDDPNRNAVIWLLDRMKGYWGKAFTDKWAMLKPGEMLDTWSKALRGLSEIEFKRGVKKLNDFERPPSLPEFLKACRPEVNALNAYYEAVEGSRSREQGEVGTWSHPAIFWASVRVSAFELKTQSYSNIRPRWEAALTAELAKDQWDPIPPPMVALPAPAKEKISREAATKNMEKLRAATGTKVRKDDGKDWARKILEDEKNGVSVMPIQREFAKQALKNSGETNDET